MANKLELTWYGKDEPIRVEPRLLIENTALSNTAADPDTQNMLIHGDNLLALKALESKFAGQVKCIYIDPPYNTGSAFEHYDDNLEHSEWLNLMLPRLKLLRELLSDDGSIWISIDADEAAYLKVLCDEVFGRNNYRTTVTWQRKYSVSNNFRGIATISEYVLVYSKSESFKCNLLPRTQESIARYSNPDNDPRGPWKAVDYLNQATTKQRPNLCYDIINPFTGEIIKNGAKAWKYELSTHQKHVEENRLWWGIDGKNTVPALKLFLSEVRQEMTPHNWWPYNEVGHTDEAKKEGIALFGRESVFATPKPERLIERVLTLGSNPGDLVLDSFLGSGTTAAVAQKMGRRWIGVEMGNHAYTHCRVRMDKVVAGQDPGGITKAQNWQGGGGYRFYEVAPTLINKDAFDEYVINEDYDANMLAAAVALHEGFHYQPDGELFWKQSVGNENSYLFVTTRHLNSTYLDSIKDTMEEGEYLIIACRSFDNGLDKAYDNIAVKKIPQMLLERCEFGKTDYNLNIVHPPVYDDEEEQDV